MSGLHVDGNFECGAAGDLLAAQGERPEVRFFAGNIVFNGEDGVLETRYHLDMQNGTQIRVNAAGGIACGAFQVPLAPIPYDVAPTAVSLRDALVAAGYMAAPEAT